MIPHYFKLAEKVYRGEKLEFSDIFGPDAVKPEHIVEYLVITNKLQEVADQQPIDHPAIPPYFIEKKGNKYQYFHWFRGMKVMEEEFSCLEDAVKRKYQSVLSGIAGAMEKSSYLNWK